jgi:hypothetical protein
MPRFIMLRWEGKHLRMFVDTRSEVYSIDVGQILAMVTAPRRPGGGIGSRVNVSVLVRRGTPARGISPGAVSQFGSSVGNHVTEAGSPIGYRGERYLEGKTPAGGAVPLGNAVAGNVGKGGAGTGRTIYKTGSQAGMAATPRAIGPARDTLREFGPDSANARNRR